MLKGFWSYVRTDDEAEGGRIVDLAHDVVAEFGLLTGEDVDLFLDRDNLAWGDNWRATIDENLNTTAFFVPVVTPRFFRSSECRRETTAFAKKAQQLGVRELVLPVLYVDTPVIHDEDSSDELAQLIRIHQWEDWRQLRLSERTSQDYRDAVNKMARRLVDANAAADLSTSARVAAAMARSEAEDDAPGLLDRLARAEESLPEWNQSLERVSSIVQNIGAVMTHGTREVQLLGDQGTSARLRVMGRTARALNPLADQMYEETNRFVAHLHDIDDGFRAIVQMAPEYVSGDRERTSQVCGFFASIRRLSKAADSGLGSVQEFVDTTTPLESMSRDLRRPLKKLREGLERLLEARSVTAEWIALVEASGLDCGADISLTD